MYRKNLETKFLKGIKTGALREAVDNNIDCITMLSNMTKEIQLLRCALYGVTNEKPTTEETNPVGTAGA